MQVSEHVTGQVTAILGPELCERVRLKAEQMNVSLSVAVAVLVRLGLEAQAQRERELEKLVCDFRSREDPTASKHLGEELGRTLFGR